MMIDIIVLDYCTCEVRIYRNIIIKSEQTAEDWLEENDPDWNESQCYYMSCDAGQLTIKDKGVSK